MISFFFSFNKEQTIKKSHYNVGLPKEPMHWITAQEETALTKLR